MAVQVLTPLCRHFVRVSVEVESLLIWRRYPIVKFAIVGDVVKIVLEEMPKVGFIGHWLFNAAG